MNLDNVIAQLKTYVTALSGRVSGSADFATGIETSVNMTLPAGYVYPLDDDAEPNDLMPGVNQIVHERIAVAVEFDNTANGDADRRTGYAGADQVNTMKYALHAALLEWIPADVTGRTVRGFSYGGGRLLSFDRARLFWQFEYVLPVLITDADGFVPRGDPLSDIKSTLQPEGDTSIPPIVIDNPVPS